MVAGRPSPAPLGPVYPAGSALGGGWGLLWPYGTRVVRWCLHAVKNRKNIQEQTKPYLQNKQLILACGSRARQRLPADGQKCDMESQVGHIAINRPDKVHQSLIYYARAHTHARSAKMTKNMAVLRSL